MPVRSTARNQSKEIDKCSKSLHVLGHMTRVLYFDPVESKLHELFQSLAAAVLAGMSPHGNCACGVGEVDRFADLEPRFWNEAGATRTEIPVKSFSRITHVSAANESARDVRSTYCTTGRFCHHSLELDIDAKMSQTLDDVLRARFARIAKGRQMRLEVVSLRDVKRE